MNKLLLGCLLFFLTACTGNKSKKSNATSNSRTEIKNNSEAALMTSDQLDRAAKIIAEYNDSAESHDGLKIYKTYCSICHGQKGDLMVNQAKDLTKSSISLENAVAQVYFGKGLMTPFKDILNEDQIISVSNYVETLRK
jgi:mono/diheme cytochrome c family protein